MPEETAAATSSTGGGQSGTSHLPWHLVPSFKPGETDVNEYTRRLEFLANVWPTEHLSQLAPRACLLCEGTAFQKVVRLDPMKLKVQSLDGIKLVVQTLGGVWGQSKTEHKYERFERAIFGTIQKSDETHTSYIARHEVQYEDLLGLGATLEEMRAYILLRNSGLNPEDKKRVIVDAQGNLQYQKVIEAIQLLGSRFFNEVQSGNQKSAGRVKTYDINYIDEPGESEVCEPGETAFYSAEAWEDYALETLAQEGDEDCLVMQQFEDALIESLQGDSEVASCLNTYVEARQRLLEKTKSRGFWNGRLSKGHKGKGKPKGSFGQRFRQPLAQRIMNSSCRICGQRGHWKAECPQNPMRDQSKPSGSASGNRPAAFAGMTIAEPEVFENDEDHEPPDHAVAFTVQASSVSHPQVLSFRNALLHSALRTHNRFLRHSGKRDMFQTNWQPMVQRFRSLIRPTTSERRDTKPNHIVDPLIQVETRIEKPEEPILFASQGSSGIVDLGASLSVIGKNQFEELCQSLPENILSRMKEAPCAVNFRFGNDSTVIGDRAIYFPVQQHWIKVVVVPSNTPFLIANSVFRSLGAVIDTENNTVFFKKLQRSIPITLSDRKLYRLDFADLLSGSDVLSEENNARVSPELICQAITDKGPEKVCSDIPQKDKSNKTIGDIQGEPQAVHHEEPNPDPNTGYLNVTSPEPDKWIERTHQPIDCRDFPGVLNHVSESVRPAGQQVPPVERCRDLRERQGREHHENDLCRTEGSPDGLWNSPCGQEVHQRDVRDPVCHLVRRELQGQQETNTPEVSSVHFSASRSPGAIQREESNQAGSSKQGHAQRPSSSFDGEPTDRRQSCCHRATDSDIERGRGLRGGSLESSSGSQQPRASADARSSSPDGECHGSGPQSSEQSRRSPFGPASVIVNDESPSLTVPEDIKSSIESAWDEFISSHEDKQSNFDHSTQDVGENIFSCGKDNWVAQEMWQYMASQGVKEGSTKGRNIKSLLLEIYCSSNSQLVCQAQNQGFVADRHGLKQGDLRNHESRVRLYRTLLTLQPRHVWVSPRCKAWCKWSTFNMSKSPELARKVLEAREDDQVHLLLCDALYQFQVWRNSECHFHLEQPQGSEMIAQEELASI